MGLAANWVVGVVSPRRERVSERQRRGGSGTQRNEMQTRHIKEARRMRGARVWGREFERAGEWTSMRDVFQRGKGARKKDTENKRAQDRE